MTYDIYDRPNLPWPLLIAGLINGVRKAWEHPLTQMLWLEAVGSIEKVGELYGRKIQANELINGAIAAYGDAYDAPPRQEVMAWLFRARTEQFTANLRERVGVLRTLATHMEASIQTAVDVQLTNVLSTPASVPNANPKTTQSTDSLSSLAGEFWRDRQVRRLREP